MTVMRNMTTEARGGDVTVTVTLTPRLKVRRPHCVTMYTLTSL